jgi:hypothetical protein
MTQVYTKSEKKQSTKFENNQKKESLDSIYIPEPNFTQTPNVFIDKIMPMLTNAEFRVASVIIRETCGWQRNWKEMTLEKLEIATGLTRKSVIAGTNGLLKKGFIEKKQTGPKNHLKSSYRLIVGDKKPLSKKVPEYTKYTPQGCTKYTPPPRALNKEEINIRNNTKKSEPQTPPPSAIIFSVKIGDTGITKDEYDSLEKEIGKTELEETLDSIRKWLEDDPKRKIKRKNVCKLVFDWNKKYTRPKRLEQEKKKRKIEQEKLSEHKKTQDSIDKNKLLMQNLGKKYDLEKFFRVNSNGIFLKKDLKQGCYYHEDRFKEFIDETIREIEKHGK